MLTCVNKMQKKEKEIMLVLEVQNINDKPYRDYVRIYCEDKHKAELVEALDIIWEHPEGRKKIGEQYDKKGTLDIIYDDAQVMAAYGMPDDIKKALKKSEAGEEQEAHHRITLPYGMEVFAETQNGEVFSVSLIGLLAHELYHAADYVNMPENQAFSENVEFGEARITILNLERNLEIVKRFTPDNYSELTDYEKVSFLNNVYDNTELPNLLMESLQEHEGYMKDLSTGDRKIKAHIEKAETPAIDFANEIVAFANTKREYQEPQRIRDYSDGMPSLLTDYETDLEFIKMMISVSMEGISKNEESGLFYEITEQYNDVIRELQGGELVLIKDTPQAQVEKIELLGRTLEEKSLGQSEGRC
jgi:hypothetical protein